MKRTCCEHQRQKTNLWTQKNQKTVWRLSSSVISELCVNHKQIDVCFQTDSLSYKKRHLDLSRRDFPTKHDFMTTASCLKRRRLQKLLLQSPTSRPRPVSPDSLNRKCFLRFNHVKHVTHGAISFSVTNNNQNNHPNTKQKTNQVRPFVPILPSMQHGSLSLLHSSTTCNFSSPQYTELTVSVKFHHVIKPKHIILNIIDVNLNLFIALLCLLFLARVVKRFQVTRLQMMSSFM